MTFADPLDRRLRREGVRTVGTIERVFAKALGGGDDDVNVFRQGWRVDLLCRFSDAHGTVHQYAKAGSVSLERLPAPGSEVEILYMPEDPTHFCWERIGRPDPAVPRGWGAGIFAVEDLGDQLGDSTAEKALGGVLTALTAVGEVAAAAGGIALPGTPDPDPEAIARQRELFRTGQRHSAEVVSAVRAQARAWIVRGAIEYAITVRVAGTELITHAWLPGGCVPDYGDRIEVAIGGGEVALDTDERYEGPPGQAIVFTTPPEVMARRERPVRPLHEVLAEEQAKRSAVDARVQQGLALRTAAPGAPRASAPPAENDLQKLRDLAASGVLTAEEFEAMQQKLQGS